ncbi:MAG: hypothetical protein Q4C70_05170 [Planctomycetia bacterium]|nr:hypothetical protein [Planctomycetia bacterium]
MKFSGILRSACSALVTLAVCVCVFNSCMINLYAAETSNTAEMRKMPKKKFIELGWDIPDTEFIRDNYQKMEVESPFSGVIYEIRPRNGKFEDSSQWLLTPDKWNRENFRPCIEDIKSCQFETFTDNFIRMNFTPGTVPWDDDAGWETLAEKAAICAWVAKENGSRGVCVDFETYGNTIFRWEPDKMNGLTFQEAKKYARKRGNQFLSAVAKEFPDAVILTLFMNSANFEAAKQPDVEAALMQSGYGLLPSFVDGMLEAATPEMILVDGCETGYYIEEEQFKDYALDMVLWTGKAMKLVAPELRQKYRAQVQCSFGLYLDMYTNPEAKVNYKGPKREGETRYDRYIRSVEDSLNAVDQYVWIYGEHNRWWNIPEEQNPEKPCFHWEEKLPGITNHMRYLIDPQWTLGMMSRRVAEGLEGENCLKNPTFSKVEDGRVTDWLFWQNEEKPVGRTFAETVGDTPAVSYEKVVNGCSIQILDVKPGEQYFTELRVRTAGKATAHLNVSWQDENGWRWELSDVFEAPKDVPADENGWKTIRGWFLVPPGITKMHFMPSVADQETAEDTCSFADAKLYRLR